MNKAYKILFSFFLILMSGMGFSQSVPSYVPTNGLVGWWGFNGNAQDGSGNGNHGTVNGATLTTDRFGNQNGAYDFDGIDDYVGTNATGPGGRTSRSYSFWIKTSSSLIQTPIDYYGQTGSAFQAILNSPCPGIGLDGAFGVVTRGSSYLINDDWHHCVLVFDSLNDVTISDVDMYIDGILQTSIICSAANPNLVVNTIDPVSFVFGKTTSNVRYVNGKLDDIGIWNRALTPQEITNLYNSQLPAQTSLCLPTITTSSPSSVGVDTVVIGGDISNDGGSSIVLRGICYSTSTNPNMGNQRTEDGSGTGSFNTILRGLTSSTTYYARSYAKNTNGVVVYGNEVSFTTSASLPGLRCPGTPTVTDIDGNIYNTVQIGTQCWTQSNLKVSKYRNGDSIPYVTDNLLWSQNVGFGSCCHYDNNLYFDTIGVGRLYNGYTVLDVRGLCPTGWHIPVDADWTIIENAVGGSSVAGIALKSSSINIGLGGWPLNPLVNNSNSSGFSALSGGFRDGFGVFDDFGRGGGWWSASRIDSLSLWSRRPDCCSNNWLRMPGNQIGGFSVRCLKNTIPQVNTTSVTNVTPSTALVTGEVISEGGDQNTTKGFCYSTTPNPTISNDTTMNGTGTGVYSGTLQNLTPSTTYYVRAYATNSIGTSYGNEVSITTTVPPQPCPGTPTVTDIDGNVYNTVQIGTQCWTQSNLKVSKYRNGDNIPTGLSSSDWQNTYSAAYAIYDNDPVNDSLYGKLYNHYAVTDSRGLCPTGWHVPSDGEWTTLENHLGGSIVAGDALRSTATQPTPGGWNPPNTGATNSSGFTALPGGLRATYMYDFGCMTFKGCWWSSSFRTAMEPLTRYLYGSTSIVERGSNVRGMGFSVRCLKNTLPQVNTTSITNVTPSTALVTGEVISEGDQNTTRGFCYSTTSNPTISNDTTMNGTGLGVYSDTLQNLTPSTTHYVRAYATNSVGTSYGAELSFITSAIPSFTCGTSTVSDVDNNTYNTVQIGIQCWTQSNLKVSKYRNWDSIPTGLSNSAWENTTSGAYAIYNNDPVNDDLYGKLYNHYAVTDNRGLCPTGWHVPSDGEWTTLENHLGGSGVAGGVLKSTATQPTPGGWNYPNTGATNSSGFTALSGGVRSSSGGFNIMTDYGFWWSSSISSASDAWCRSLNYYFSYVYRPSTSRTLGLSVRCLKD